MTLIAILLPWLSFLLRGRIITGIICLILQITLIGWIPGSYLGCNFFAECKGKTREREGSSGRYGKAAVDKKKRGGILNCHLLKNDTSKISFTSQLSLSPACR